uniref:Uncharacterized protein n=1 Tax=Amphimedon queenslandica TaxID=400682 RepID=A0A1X7V432_AMPQE
KHKYPENRSALTYWEEEAPSRLDLGKEKYGGPFTEEEVEDVKTVFRMLPLFINQYVCSDFYYYLTQAVLLFILLIVFLFLAKHYKYRIRDNEVNIYQIVDGTYQNYLNQEKEYNQGCSVTTDHN